MKKILTVVFYLGAFGAVSYFLWQYLHIPRVFLISLIASLGLLLILAANKSRYIRPIGIFLLIAHIIWLAAYFIPVYEKTPDIRQRYRRSPNTIRTLSSVSSGMVVTLVSQEQTQTLLGPNLFIPKPIFQGNRIVTAGPSLQSSERVLVGFRDGSNIQLLPQSSVLLESLAPNFATLSGSRIGIALESGIIGIHTRRSAYNPEDRYVRAGDLYFSCRECIIAFSGDRGTIGSNQQMRRWIADGDTIDLSGGTYSFARNSVTATNNSTLLSLLGDMHTTTVNHTSTYDLAKKNFITEQRGRAMDNSFLLGTLSKVKMAVIGLFDWTYRTKYNNLMLYEYMQEKSDTIPPPFEKERTFYEFIE